MLVSPHNNEKFKVDFGKYLVEKEVDHEDDDDENDAVISQA